MMPALTAGDNVLLRPEPFRASVMQIEPQWIDYNGHLNMAYYNVMFDRAIDELWLKIGIGPGYMKVRNASEGWLSATSENMTIHIDMAARKTAPFPPDIRARIQALANAHATIPRPEGIGRKIAMPSK